MPTIAADIAVIPAPKSSATSSRRLPRLVGLSMAAVASLGLWCGLLATLRFLA